MKINWNYIKGFLLLGLVVFLYGFSASRNELQKVEGIEIEFEQGSNLFMTHEMVNKLLIQNNSELQNQAKSMVDLHNLEANVLSHPMVEAAAIYVTVDGMLKTKVKQRTPIARVIKNNGSYYIDKQAKIMPLSEHHSARVMLVTGNVTENDTPEVFKLTTAILNDDFLKKQIIGIHINGSNEYILSTRVGEQNIELGDLNNLKQKFKNLNSFYKKTMAENSLEQYATINLKFNNQVVCTKK